MRMCPNDFFIMDSYDLFIFFSLFSFILAQTFISLQIKEFRIMGLSINDSVYGCVFFFLIGLHFFHLLVGLFLLNLLSWSCSFSLLMSCHNSYDKNCQFSYPLWKENQQDKQNSKFKFCRTLWRFMGMCSKCFMNPTTKGTTVFRLEYRQHHSRSSHRFPSCKT